MCIGEIFECIGQLSQCVESQCVFMQGKHTWYQLGITIFSLVQLIFQVFHFSQVGKASQSLEDIVLTCTPTGSVDDIDTLKKASSQALALQKEERYLMILVGVYFVFLFFFLIVFDFCKVEEKCNKNKSEAEEIQKKEVTLFPIIFVYQFKCRQFFKVLLQIGFVGLLIKVIMTARQSKELATNLKEVDCVQASKQILDIAKLFDTTLYGQVLMNLAFLVLQICLDYNCLLFPTVKDTYLVHVHDGLYYKIRIYQILVQEEERLEEQRIIKMRKKRRGGEGENDLENPHSEANNRPNYLQEQIQRRRSVFPPPNMLPPPNMQVLQNYNQNTVLNNDRRRMTTMAVPVSRRNVPDMQNYELQNAQKFSYPVVEDNNNGFEQNPTSGSGPFAWPPKDQ